MSLPMIIAHTRRERVLLVDALACDRQILADALWRELAVQVFGVSDAYAALRLTQVRADWDAVVVALDQPGLNGFELFFQIEAACGRPVAVAFISAGSPPRHVRLAEGRTVPVLLKPVDVSLLAAAWEQDRLPASVWSA